MESPRHNTMGFRGVLLQRQAGSQAASFETICKTAELVLLVERHETSDIDPTGVVDAKILFQDYSNRQLLSVARMADVALEANAIFWTINNATVHCFHFESEFCFGEVIRGIKAIRRTEQLALIKPVAQALSFDLSTIKKGTGLWNHYANCADIAISALRAKDPPLQKQTLKANDINRRAKSATKKDDPKSTKRKNELIATTLDEITDEGNVIHHSVHAPSSSHHPAVETAEEENAIDLLSEDAAERKAFNLQWIVNTRPSTSKAPQPCHLCDQRYDTLQMMDVIIYNKIASYSLSLGCSNYTRRTKTSLSLSSYLSIDEDACSNAPKDISIMRFV
jgi:hypothetical protein